MSDGGETGESPGLDTCILKRHQRDECRDDIAAQLLVQDLPVSIDQEKEYLQVVCPALLRFRGFDGVEQRRYWVVESAALPEGGNR